MRGYLLAVSAALGLAVAVAAGAEEPTSVSGRTSYQLYCASCHGPNAEGAAGALRASEQAPPLSHLGDKFGLPLPRARLSKFIQLDTRMGGGRLCGDRLLPDVPAMQARSVMERAVVAEALAYVETLQAARSD